MLVGVNCPRPAPNPLPTPPDHLLVQQVRQDNQDAAAALYDRYAPRLRALARAECSPLLARYLDADDIVQAVYCSLFRGLRRGSYDVAPGERLWGLLRAIALNFIRARAHYFRAAKRDVRRTVCTKTLPLSALPQAPRGPLTCSAVRLDLAQLIDRLPAAQGPVVRAWLEGYGVAEIVRQSGHPTRTVERWLGIFRKRLAELLRKED